MRDAGTLSAEVVRQEDRSADGSAMGEALPGSSTESPTWTTERPVDARNALGGLAEIGGERGSGNLMASPFQCIAIHRFGGNPKLDGQDPGRG